MVRIALGVQTVDYITGSLRRQSGMQEENANEILCEMLCAEAKHLGCRVAASSEAEDLGCCEAATFLQEARKKGT